MTENYKNLQKKSQDYMSNLYENKVVIKVQTGTSGQAVGADEILKVLSLKSNDKINVIEVGSMGFMYLEPILVVNLPSKDKIFYAHVTESIAEKIY